MKRLLLVLCVLGFASPAWATAYTCTNGQYIANADILLAATDTIDFVGTAGARCSVLMNNHKISLTFSTTFTGHIKVNYADVFDAGPTEYYWIAPVSGDNYFVVGGSGYIEMQHDVFHRSGVLLRGYFTSSSTFTWNYNVYGPDNTGPAAYNHSEGTGYQGFLFAGGTTSGSSTVQGNLVQRSWMIIQTPHTTIGAPSTCANASDAALGNIMVGQRVGLNFNANTSTAVCNYIHTIFDVSPDAPSANDEENLNGVGSGSRFHDNILINGEWMVSAVTGEVDHNIIAMYSGHNYVRNGTRGSGQDGTVHHNIVFGSTPTANAGRYGTTLSAGTGTGEQAFALQQGGGSLEFYNNTFDGRYHTIAQGIEVTSGATLTAARNNAFYSVYLPATSCPGTQLTCGGMIAGDQSETGSPSPKPTRATYSDYNSFHYAADTGRKKNYLIGTGGTECSGTWGSHDLGTCPDGGAANPNFKGPLPIGSGNLGAGTTVDAGFPFLDQDIISGRYTVPQILDYFRSVYMPNSGSTLLNAGSDGAHIGAVQSDPASALISVNKRPVVWAGPSFTTGTNIYGGDIDHAQLVGFAWDDGKGSPDGTLTCAWTTVNKPVGSTVTFDHSTYCANTATLSAAGVYTFRLTATDGALSSFMDVTVTKPSTFFVATTGSDSNPGTITSPWLTIGYGVAHIVAGQTLYIRGGTYAGGGNTIHSDAGGVVPSGTSFANAPIISGYPGETVTLTPTVNAIKLTTGAPHYLIFQDLTIDMSLESDSIDSSPEAIYASDCAHHVRFQRLILKNSMGHMVQWSYNNCATPAAGFFELLNSRCTAAGLSTGDSGHGGAGIDNGYCLYNKTTDNLVEGNQFDANMGTVLNLYADRNVVRKNFFIGNGVRGGPTFAINFGSSAYPANSDGNQAQNNIIVGQNGGGINAYTNTLNTGLFNNTIKSVTGSAINVRFTAGTTTARNNIFRLNGTNDVVDIDGTNTIVKDHNLLGTDPQFTNGSGSFSLATDFTLQAGSPAVNAGVSTGAPTTDYAGTARPQGAAYDEGAYER